MPSALDHAVQRIKNFVADAARSSTARKVAFVYVGDVASKVINVFNTWLIIRLLSQDDYALFTIFLGFGTLSASLVGGGVQTSMVRFAAEYLSLHGSPPYRAYRVALASIVIAFGLFSCGVFLGRQWIAGFAYGTLDAAVPVVFGLLYGFGFMLGEFARSIFQSEERFSVFVASLWLRQVATLGALLVLGRSGGLAFEEVSWTLGLVSLAVGAVLAAYSGAIRRASTTSDAPPVAVSDVVASFGWIITYQIVLASFSQLDVMALSKLSTTYEVASYGVAFRYYVAGIMVLASVQAVLRPRLSRPENLTRAKLRHFLKRWLVFSASLIPPLGLIAAFGRGPYVWLNGIEYGPSFDAFRVLLLCVWQGLAFSPMAGVLLGKKRFKTLFLLACIAMLTSLGLNVLLVPGLGAMGAAIATAGAYSVLNVSSFVIALRLAR